MSLSVAVAGGSVVPALEAATERRRVRVPWVELLLLAAYAALVLALTLHHEAWRDEADAWLVARDASLAQVLHLTHYMGTPALWYLLLMPAAKLGAPYLVMALFNATIAVAAVGLVLLAAPLSRPTKALLVFSFLISFEYPVVARSYALAMLLLFALIAVLARRGSRGWAAGTLLVLLANTNAHGLVLAGSAWLALAGEAMLTPASRTKARARELVLGALGGLLALAQLWPAADRQTPDPPGLGQALQVLEVTTHGAFFPVLGDGGTHWGGLVLLACIALSLARRPTALVFLAASIAGLQGVFVFGWPGGARHWGFMLLAAVAALWMARREASASPARPFTIFDPRVGQVALAVSLPFSVWTAGVAWAAELRSEYSGAKRMARYLVEHGLDREPIAAHQATACLAVLPYLPRRDFFYPAVDASGTHLWWDRATSLGARISQDETLARIDRRFPREDGLLLLLSRPLGGAAAQRFQLLFVSDRQRFTDEAFFLYRRRGPPPPRPASPGQDH